MTLKKGYKALIAEAEAKTKGISADEAQAALQDPNTLFVDIRDVRELERDGMIPGAFHAPRGMLEFWADPESPYFKPPFEEKPGKRFVLYCAASIKTLLSLLKTSSTEAPYFNSAAADAVLPYLVAKSRGVQPSLSRIFGLAPCSNNRFTASEFSIAK